MADDDAISFLSGAQGLRLRTLVWLRWLAIFGQTIAVTVVCFGLGFRVPIMLALGVILASALLNVGLALRFPMSHRLSDRLAALLLGADILQLAGLLYLTGGLENPFAILFVAPVLISAMALAPGRTLALGVLAGCAVSALALSHLPLPWYADASIELPPSLSPRHLDRDHAEPRLHRRLCLAHRQGGARPRPSACRDRIGPGARAAPFPARRPRGGRGP